MWYVYLCIVSIITYFQRYYFTLNRNVHAYGTRQCQLLHVPPCPSNLTKRGVKYWGVKIWNQLLGQEIDIDVSQPIFKHNCKRIISAGHLYYIWANLKCCYGMESVYNVFSVSDWDCLCYSVVCFQSTSINWWNVSMLAPLHLAHELDHLRWNSHWDI